MVCTQLAELFCRRKSAVKASATMHSFLHREMLEISTGSPVNGYGVTLVLNELSSFISSLFIFIVIFSPSNTNSSQEQRAKELRREERRRIKALEKEEKRRLKKMAKAKERAKRHDEENVHLNGDGGKPSVGGYRFLPLAFLGHVCSLSMMFLHRNCRRNSY